MSSKFRKLMKFLPNFFMVLGAVSVAFAMLLSMVNLPVSAEQSEDLQCPVGGETFNSSGEGVGFIITINGPTVTFNVEVEFCVKASRSNSGVLTGTSYTVDFLNNGGQIPNISHVVVYGVIQPTPTNPPPPTNTPVPDQPTVTSTPVDPTATHTPVDPTATNTPVDPTATSTPVNPTATNTPVDPTATNTPVDPTATNTPVNPTATNTPVPNQPTATNTPEVQDPSPTNTPDDPTSTSTPIYDEPTATPADPGTSPTPPADETPVPQIEPTLPIPVTAGTPQVIIPVTGSIIDFGSPLEALQKLMFNFGLGFLGIGLVLQAFLKKKQF